jgi:hypothetical protein
MSWSIEIKDINGAWHAIHRPGKFPEEFNTAKEARTVLEYLYPQEIAAQRAGGDAIVKIRNNSLAFQGG